MFCFVFIGNILPDVVRLEDVAGSQAADFTGTHSCQTLKTNHVSDNSWQVRQSRLNDGIFHTLHRPSLARDRSALLQTG